MPKIKATDKVRVIKPGIFKDLEGDVISSGSTFKISLGVCGTWNFKATEIELLNNKKQK